jgi:membrane-bound serine protease (ClpP class)
VGSGGKDIEGTLGKKAVSDLAALIKSLAKRRGLDPKFAEEMVTEAKSYDATQAKELKIIDLIARDLGFLLKELEGREVQTGEGKRIISTKGKALHFHKPGARESLLSVLANPNLVYILMMIGLMGLYFELSHPGTIFPGVVGGISLILALFGMSTLPVNMTGLALIGLAIVLFIVEIKVASQGLLSLGGAVSLILGSIMLFESEDSMLRVSLMVLIPTVTGVVAFFLGVTFLAMRAQVSKSPTGQEGLLGETAVVMDQRRVKIMGEIWRAASPSPLAPGQKVKVKKVKGLLLEVEPLGEDGIKD